MDRGRIGWTIDVLDHGYVKLIDFMGSDEAIVEDARMSTGRGFISWEPYQRCKVCNVVRMLPDERACGCGSMDFETFPRGDLGILTTLHANRHTTPFETGGEMKIEVQAPLFVFREWHRHRTQSYNEFSARYAQMPDLHYVPELSRIKKQSATNKQGSGETLDAVVGEAIREDFKDEQRGIYARYDKLVEGGLAKEIARINTPVSRYSKMRAKTDLHNWLGFLRLRHHPAAQYEIQMYARAVAEMVSALWPRTWALFEEHDLGGVRLSKSEARALHDFMRQKATEDLETLGPSTEKLVKKLGGAL